VRPTLPRTPLLILLLMLSFTGCGYKGPLYLPKDKPAAAKPAPPPAPAAEPARQP
jgi:predicted small lipoprotein YifL